MGVVGPADITIVDKDVLLFNCLTWSYTEVVLVLERFEAEAEHLLDLHSREVRGRCIRVLWLGVADFHHLLLIMLKRSLVYLVLVGLMPSKRATYIIVNAFHSVFARDVIGGRDACVWLLTFSV